MNPRFLSLRLLAIFIVASIFCYWLAWYLSAPAGKLRRATRQLASGDLKTRVSPQFGGRKDELAALGSDFDTMAERIEYLLTSQGRLLRDISHELRSPLTRLNVALELARQHSGEEAHAFLDRIERESERMNKLIGQLRTLTLIESGSERIDKRRLDLSSIVEEVAEDADYEAGGREKLMKTTIQNNIMIEGSGELLRRAIENVVRNAVRYTVQDREVEITLQQRDIDGNDYAVLKVRDYGPGVPEEALADLFNPFYRVAESRDRQSGGMGIGLAITAHAVRLHNGTVRADNADGGGLAVEIALPL